MTQGDIVSANQWQGQYFPKNKGAVEKALTKLISDRSTYQVFNNTDLCSNCPPLWYMQSLTAALSTVFSATGALWQVNNLSNIARHIPELNKLCDEYAEARVELAHFKGPAEDEVYMACLLRLGSLRRIVSRNDYSFEEVALQVGNEAIEQTKSRSYPISTVLLLKARHSTNVLVQPAYRRVLAKEVRSEVSKLMEGDPSPGEIEQKIVQGYKTICRLGRMTKSWQICRTALKYDRSKDLVMKTWMLPDYWFYQLKYRLGLTP